MRVNDALLHTSNSLAAEWSYICAGVPPPPRHSLLTDSRPFKTMQKQQYSLSKLPNQVWVPGIILLG